MCRYAFSASSDNELSHRRDASDSEAYGNPPHPEPNTASARHPYTAHAPTLCCWPWETPRKQKITAPSQLHLESSTTLLCAQSRTVELLVARENIHPLCLVAHAPRAMVLPQSQPESSISKQCYAIQQTETNTNVANTQHPVSPTHRTSNHDVQ